MRTFVAAPAAEGSYPGVVFYTDIFQLTEPTPALGGAARRLRIRGRRPRDLPPGRAAGDGARVRRRGQGARPGRRRGADHGRSSTRTSRRRWRGWRARCSAVGAAGHCTGGHLAFRAAFDERVRGTACWYADRPAQRQARRRQDRLAGARGRDRRRAPADLRHPRSAHAAGRAATIVRAGLEGTRFDVERVRRRARVRPRHRPSLRPGGDRPGVRRDRRVLPADAVRSGAYRGTLMLVSGPNVVSVRPPAFGAEGVAGEQLATVLRGDGVGRSGADGRELVAGPCRGSAGASGRRRDRARPSTTAVRRSASRRTASRGSGRPGPAPTPAPRR